MADEGPDVDGGAAALDGVEVLGERREGPFLAEPLARAAAVIPSTFSRVRTIVSRCSGRVGATEKPQFPMTTVVTPCQGEMVSMRSHMTWAS